MWTGAERAMELDHITAGKEVSAEQTEQATANVTSQICSAEAAENRVILRDDDGNLMFSSPYLKPLVKEYPTVDAYRLPNDTEMAASSLENLSSVPLPYARPVQ